MRTGSIDPRDRVYVQVGAGTRLSTGYGAPDFRILGSIGTYWNLLDFKSKSPARRYKGSSDVDMYDRDTDGDQRPLPGVDPHIQRQRMGFKTSEKARSGGVCLGVQADHRLNGSSCFRCALRGRWAPIGQVRAAWILDESISGI